MGGPGKEGRMGMFGYSLLLLGIGLALATLAYFVA